MNPVGTHTHTQWISYEMFGRCRRVKTLNGRWSYVLRDIAASLVHALKTVVETLLKDRPCSVERIVCLVHYLLVLS